MPLNPPMQYTQAGINFTAGFEGRRLQAYQDSVGRWTIGDGHTLGVGPGLTCIDPQADAWLQEDLQGAVDAVNQGVDVPLTQDEFNALVDFAFNLGDHALLASTLLRLLNQGDYAGAAAQFQLWDHAGGQVVAGLLRRRLAERDEFLQTPPASGVA